LDRDSRDAGAVCDWARAHACEGIVMRPDVKQGDPVGPMSLPASFFRGDDQSSTAPNKGAPHKGTPRGRGSKSGRLPPYYYDF
jgi:hypothetical protein